MLPCLHFTVSGKHLGSGNFGNVRLATLNGRTIAVKSQSPADGTRASFIALLTELKVMLYIEKQGGHDNIVRLVGANTTDIKTCDAFTRHGFE